MNPSSPSMKVLGFGCFGKLPVSREFIIEGIEDLADSGFDRWVGEGVGLAKARLGPDFKERISSFPSYRFYWDGGNEKKLAGVVIPSEDAAGRKHPFAFFARLQCGRISALSSALRVWGLQEQTAELMKTISLAESPSAIREFVRSTRHEPVLGGTGFEDQYRRFLQERSGEDFWQNLEGSGTGDMRFMVFQSLHETLMPMGGDNSRVFRGGIRYPLPQGGGKETAFGSCFWLDLTERRLGQDLGQSWWVRSPGGVDAGNRNLFLYLTRPGGAQWSSLVDPEVYLDSVSYLDRPYGVDPPEQRMDPGLRAILESRDSTLGDYLNWASGP